MLRAIQTERLQSRSSRTVARMFALWRAWTPIVAVAVGISACAVSSVQPLTVPLVYKAGSKQPALAGAFACSAVSLIQAIDLRADKTLGMRTHESKPLKAEVSASGEAGSWVAEGVQTYLTQNGIHVQGSGPVLSIALESLRTSESIWHRASYESRITMSARLHTPAGQICWEDRFEGTSGDYGYAGNIETYEGTLNGALDAASLRLAESPGFRNALCHCGN